MGSAVLPIPTIPAFICYGACLVHTTALFTFSSFLYYIFTTTTTSFICTILPIYHTIYHHYCLLFCRYVDSTTIHTYTYATHGSVLHFTTTAFFTTGLLYTTFSLPRCLLPFSFTTIHHTIPT